MFSILANPTYRNLFAAQVISLLGTGLMTVALGLMAFDLAGARAGAVLGTALAIKMVAYVGFAPLADALAARLPRKAVLIGADLLRASVAMALPFVDAVWQIYVLIFVLQAASASFTPAFQATIPDILTEEEDYTNALSLSRLAYDLENLVSPALAGVLLLLMSYHNLFAGTVLGFLGSAVLVAGAAVPPRARDRRVRSFREQLTRGVRIYLATPRLRGSLALNMAAAAAGAFVIVNTVVLVRAGYGGSAPEVARALTAFGGGSMLAALVLPRLLLRARDRTVMVRAAVGLSLLTLLFGLLLLLRGLPAPGVLLAAWAVLGFLYTSVLTPTGRLLRRSSRAEDRPALFAAQFALSHACWLVTYPLAGWLGKSLGLAGTMIVLGVVAALAAFVALRLWPANAAREIEHDHPDLPPDHPHLRQHDRRRHTHVFVIDDEHHAWPG